jgi:hypothetical protein
MLGSAYLLTCILYNCLLLATYMSIVCDVLTHTQVKFYVDLFILWGHAVVQLVEALRYKSEGRGLNSQWCHWNFSLT